MPVIIEAASETCEEAGGKNQERGGNAIDSPTGRMGVHARRQWMTAGLTVALTDPA
jgi:hypothetical protein